MGHRGDWKFDPEDIVERWDAARDAQLVDIMGPTHKFGRNLGWYLVSKRTPVRTVCTETVPGTGHIGVTLNLGTAGQGMLGRRMIPPIPNEALERVGGDQWQEEHAGCFGDAPGSWKEWTYRAELGLVRAACIEVQKGIVHRGIGANLARRNVRFRAARQDMYQLLLRTGTRRH